jgi:hypothetical protein
MFHRYFRTDTKNEQRIKSEHIYLIIQLQPLTKIRKS